MPTTSRLSRQLAGATGTRQPETPAQEQHGTSSGSKMAHHKGRVPDSHKYTRLGFLTRPFPPTPPSSVLDVLHAGYFDPHLP